MGEENHYRDMRGKEDNGGVSEGELLSKGKAEEGRE